MHYVAQSEIVEYKMVNVFMHLFVGLFLAGIVSYVVSTIPMFIKYYSVFFIIWIIASLGLIFLGSLFATNRFISTFIYYAYCILEGFALSPIFLVYAKSTIFIAFLSTGLVCLVVYFLAKQKIINVTNLGIMLLIATIVGLIASLINIFILHSSLLSTILNFAFIIIFSLWFMYDLQTMEENIQCFSEAFIALCLFIDVVGIFLNILQLLGSQED